ncbi:MAG TPA: response regulator [Gaiellaceae bacterium]|nr:response regulator [Gaiellaceae bacterium]
MSDDAVTILVCDDDPDIRALVTYRFETAGYRIVAAGDGPTAIELAFSESPALAVLDVMMPGMSGMEVTRRLREDPRTERMPIILLTSRSLDKDVTSGFDAGADDYVTKPFSPQELLHRARAILGRR